MSNFDINDVINQLVDKLADKLKGQLIAAVAKSEKQAIKRYIASQKDTGKSVKTTKGISATGSSGSKKTSPPRRAVKRESDYKRDCSETESDSD